VATAEGVLFVDLDDLRVSGPYLGDHGPVRAVAYSPDGSMFAAALGDGSVALWDGRSVQPLGAPVPLAWASALAFSPDSGSLAALGLDGNAAVIATDPEVWQRSACEIASRQLTRAEWETFLPGMRYKPAC
jgi:WD40 repeat protein